MPTKDHLIPFFHLDAALSSLAVKYNHPEYINHTATTVHMKNVADKK
jgi:hypothetical protein